METDDIKKALMANPTELEITILDTDYLRTGSTMLDMALTGNPLGGFAKGHYFWWPGASSGGKTFGALTCMAEASINPNFDEYRLIFDDVEDGALMDKSRYFGPRLARRLEAPGTDSDGKPVFSRTVEEFYFNITDAIDDGRPFIYLLDSMDSLGSKYADAKFDEAKKADRKGTTAKGDFGDGKAKYNSEHLKGVKDALRKNGSILIILSQLRDNIGGGPFDPKYVTAGGHALKYYAAAQLWSLKGKELKKEYRGNNLSIGFESRVEIRKNRLTGKEWDVSFPIYHSTGLDDTGSMVDWLVKFEVWKKKGGYITAPDFKDLRLQREKLIQHIEENGLREDVIEVVAEAWAEVEEALKVDRKSRYE